MVAGLSQLLAGARSPPGLPWPSPLARHSRTGRSLAARHVCMSARGEGASGWARRLEREVKSQQAWSRRAATGFGWDFHSPGAPQCPVGRAETVLGLLQHHPGASHPLGMLLAGGRCGWGAAPAWRGMACWRPVLGLRPSVESWCPCPTRVFRVWGAEAMGSACPKAIGEGQAHAGTKSSGLSQRSWVAQWGCLVLCHLEPERPLAFLLLPSQPQSRTTRGRDQEPRGCGCSKDGTPEVKPH